MDVGSPGCRGPLDTSRHHALPGQRDGQPTTVLHQPGPSSDVVASVRASCPDARWPRPVPAAGVASLVAGAIVVVVVGGRSERPATHGWFGCWSRPSSGGNRSSLESVRAMPWCWQARWSWWHGTACAVTRLDGNRRRSGGEPDSARARGDSSSVRASGSVGAMACAVLTVLQVPSPLPPARWCSSISRACCCSPRGRTPRRCRTTRW